MTDLNKNLSDIFNINPISDPITDESTTKQNVLPVNYNKPNIENDLVDAYQESRENLRTIIDQGHDALDTILGIAKEGQHPRAFEVYGNLLKNMVDANKELLNIQKQMRDMDKKKEVNNTNIDKAIFVGSTAELTKFLKDTGKEIGDK
jgi:hypothetical protein